MEHTTTPSTTQNAIVSRPSGEAATDEIVAWLESSLPRIMRRLMDSENLDMPLLQLPLAQMRLAQALYNASESPETMATGETMGRLSERLGVRQNALTQAADRLINHGLAERVGDPHDRRVVRLRLTEKGNEWVRERRARRRAHLRQLWALMDTVEREEFVRAVRTLEAAANRLSERPTQIASETSADRPEATVEETLSRFTIGAANSSCARVSTPTEPDTPRQTPARMGPMETVSARENTAAKEGEL